MIQKQSGQEEEETDQRPGDAHTYRMMNIIFPFWISLPLVCQNFQVFEDSKTGTKLHL